MKSCLRPLVLLLVAPLFGSGDALAQRRGGGGAQMSRGSARTSVTARSPASSRPNVDRDVNVNRAVNVDREVNINAQGGYYDRDYGCCHHPVATAAAATTAAAVTAAAIGSRLYTLPPACTRIVVNGVSYQRCGSTWYQPQFSGTETVYIVVAPPQ